MATDSRSIDFAATASIDMMSLNNKVVNMRQIVKRTKVQVVNKLCKNITALKKKKGTDEQKAQNLRKAERFIEEIDSIKHLKEDKVSKYALANTLSFKDVCKASLSAGPRALARLTDHPLMQKVVGDFRKQHPDWKDLAAYLLVKQTGRRFKTKKQKQRKKLSQSVANINASETMTKAYIQERFGEEGLRKAEQRFEKKRKRLPPDEKGSLDDAGDDPSETESKKKRKEAGDLPGRSEEGSDGDNNGLNDSSDQEKSDSGSNDNDNEVGCKANNDHITASNVTSFEDPHLAVNLESGKVLVNSASMSRSLETNTTNENEETLGNQIASSQSVNKFENSAKLNFVSSENMEDSDSDNSVSDDSMESDRQDSQQTKQSVLSKKRECVVKEIEIDKADNIISDEESSAETSNEENEEDKDSNSDSGASTQKVPSLSNRQKKKSKSKFPSLLTSQPPKPVSDPFFAGSDDEGEEEGTFNDFDDALSRNLDEEDEAGAGGGTKSMFYNPEGDIYRKGVRVPARGWLRERGRGRWQGQERGRDRGRGGGSYHGSQRGRGRPFGGSLRGGDRGKSKGGSFNRNWDDKSPRFGGHEKPKDEQFTNTGTSKSATAPSEKLHPSWEASKKRKAEQSGIQAFKGSKITFDDDD